jgi:hypothetical protein
VTPGQTANTFAAYAVVGAGIESRKAVAVSIEANKTTTPVVKVERWLKKIKQHFISALAHLSIAIPEI